jgi:hypothetical protein
LKTVSVDPAIVSINPTTVWADLGTYITISGMYFGSSAGEAYVGDGSLQVKAQVIQWTDGTVVFFADKFHGGSVIFFVTCFLICFSYFREMPAHGCIRDFVYFFVSSVTCYAICSVF